MPKSYGQLETVQITVKLPPKTLSIIRKRAEQIGSQTEAIREAIDAVYFFFGLPDRQVDLLKEDAKRLGKDEPGYIRELLAKRYEELLLEHAKSSKK